jgi:hypothetical protein
MPRSIVERTFPDDGLIVPISARAPLLMARPFLRTAENMSEPYVIE